MENTEQQIARRQDTNLEQVREGQRIRPPVDIFENQDELLLYADLPGLTSEDLSVEMNDGLLTIQGSRTLSTGASAEDRRSYLYWRQFQMPVGIDTTKIQANLSRGVLEVHLPKMEAVKPRQIRVQGG